MSAVEVIADGFDRVDQALHRAVRGLDEVALTARVGPQANTIAWLAWHVARVQDAQIAPLAGAEQVWLADGWVDRFALPFDREASGYGQTPDEAATVHAPADLLLAYYDAAAAATHAYLRTLTDDDLDEVVDTSWNPPVTRGSRLVSILADDLQHVGQAAYVRGVVTAR